MMNSKVSPYRLLVFSAITVLLLAGCQPKADETDTPEPGETASSTTQTDDSMTIKADLVFDPAVTVDPDSLKVSQYLYDGLVKLDTAGAPQGALAESWVISDDQLDYIFTLRSGITFSDGTPITPDVIADNFNRWFDPQSPLRGDGTYAAWEQTFLGFHGEKDDDDRAKSTVDGIQKVDVNTVLIHLNRPVPELLTYLADPAFAILNPASLQDPTYGVRGSTIVSSGPYVVSSWTASELTLSPNTNYWAPTPTGDVKFTFQ